MKKSKGFGDTLAKIFKATGITWAVNKIAGNKDCGCKARQEKVNRVFPYNGNK